MLEDKKTIGRIMDTAQKGISNIDTDAIKSKAVDATDRVKIKASEAREAVADVKDDIADKLSALDNMLKDSITEYNDAYTLMNDKGIKLFVERNRSMDSIDFVKGFINSIANKPKTFDSDFKEILSERKKFTDSCEFAEREIMNAREAASNAGAGLAAGASVAFMAPSVAMWVATTFGTASTGVAISTLSGAAAQNAALAWLGGGVLAAGGHGMIAGETLLAMAGPVGWTIAGATLLSSILIFSTKKAKLNKEKNEEIRSIKENTERVREVEKKIESIFRKTSELRTGLNHLYAEMAHLYGADYRALNEKEKMMLGTMVNNTKALAELCQTTVGE